MPLKASAVAIIADGSALETVLGAGLGTGLGPLRVVGGVGAPGKGRGAAPRLAHPATEIVITRTVVMVRRRPWWCEGTTLL